MSQRKPSHRLWIAAGGLLLPLLIRSCWVVLSSETGLHPHMAVWQSSLPLPEPTPLAKKDPVEQAEFWLSELSELAQETNDPEIATGIAWMMDAPQFDFAEGYRKLAIDSLDSYDEALRRKLRPFYDRCDAVCLRAIDKAIRLDPGNLDPYRNKALLLFRKPRLRLFLEPRSDSWLRQLNELKRQDPGNGLYDYLAAGCLCQSTIRSEFDERSGEFRYEILDQQALDDSTKRFDAGNDCNFLQFARNGYPATLKVLRLTSVPTVDYPQILIDRRISNNRDSIMMAITYRVRQMSRHWESESNLTAWKAEQERLQLLLSRYGNAYQADEKLQAVLKRYSYYNLWQLHTEEPGLFTPIASDRIRRGYREAAETQEVMDEVARRLARRQAPHHLPDAPIAALQMFALTVTPEICTLAAMTAVVAWLVMRFTWPQDSSRREILDVSALRLRDWLFLMVVIGFGTVAVLGMIPAGVFSSRPPFGPRAWPDLRGATIVDVSQATLTNQKAVWSLIQWMVYHGPAITTGLVLAVASVRIWLRQRRSEQYSDFFLTAGNHAFGIARMIRRYSAVAAFVAMTTYLVTAPRLTRTLDTRYMHALSVVLNRAGVVEPLIDEVRDDTEVMNAFRNRVDQAATRAQQNIEENTRDKLR